MPCVSEILQCENSPPISQAGCSAQQVVLNEQNFCEWYLAATAEIDTVFFEDFGRPVVIGDDIADS
jgi:hypothetical protein